MKRSRELRQDALEIWRAGVEAVDSARLVREQVRQDEGGLRICGHPWSPADGGRICIVGAGKAGAGMAAGLEEALGSSGQQPWLERTDGWINVPADCVRPLKSIHLHPARPAGLNEPTQAGVAGTREILNRVGSLNPDDLCLVLISGGGSALLPAPTEGITLEEKQQVTRTLMRCGATIDELNTVRRALSSVKGGGLLRACGAGTLVALIISDVIGDPLETIASGPTVDVPPDPHSALKVLQRFQDDEGVRFPLSVHETLTRQMMAPNRVDHFSPGVCPHWNHVIGNNRRAVDAAAVKAEELGYEVRGTEADQAGVAAEEGRRLARRACELQESAGPGAPLCIISGGEPTVHLVQTEASQKGGRNQELVLAALEYLADRDAQGIAVLSGGTDGEDGPTDAAGAVADAKLIKRARERRIDPRAYLDVNNSYPFFEQLDGLIKTGPTHTNVMDLRVVLIEEREP